jgi:ribosomal protein L37E
MKIKIIFVKVKMKRFNKQCINCEDCNLGKRFYFCTNCGYPTPKKLREVDNPNDIIKRQLITIPRCASNSVRVHGLINTMHKMGYMSPGESNGLTLEENESFEKILNLY